MKHVYLISGTMGVGKTTTCRLLRDMLPDCVFLDGDWCWDMHPFKVTDETKAMVMNNICCLLNNFLKCSEFQNIVFCWVMHMQSIIDEIVGRLEGEFHLHSISLICSPERLTHRLSKDIENGVRQPDVIERSVARLPLYDQLNTLKLDVSEITPEHAARRILEMHQKEIELCDSENRSASAKASS